MKDVLKCGPSLYVKKSLKALEKQKLTLGRTWTLYKGMISRREVCLSVLDNLFLNTGWLII